MMERTETGLVQAETEQARQSILAELQEWSLHSPEELDQLRTLPAEDLKAEYEKTKQWRDELLAAEQLEPNPEAGDTKSGQVQAEDRDNGGQAIERPQPAEAPVSTPEVSAPEPNSEHRAELENQEPPAEQTPQPLQAVKPRLSFTPPAELKTPMKELAATELEGWDGVAEEENRLMDKYRIRTIRGQGLGPEGHMKAYRVLESQLNLLPSDAYRGRHFKPDAENRIRPNDPDKTVRYNPETTESALHEYFLEALGMNNGEAQPKPQETDENRAAVEESLESTAEAREPVDLPQNLPEEKLDLDKMAASAGAPKEPERSERPPQNLKATDALKEILQKSYSGFLAETLKIGARSLNKIQNFSLAELMNLYRHQEISPAQLKEFQGLADQIEKSAPLDSGSEFLKQSVKDFVINLAKSQYARE